MRLSTAMGWHALRLCLFTVLPDVAMAGNKKAKSKMQCYREQLDTVGCDLDQRFYASQNLPQIEMYISTWSMLRSTGILDFYNGQGALKSVGTHRGHVVDSFDVLNDPSENICTEEGFFKGLDKVLQVMLRGLIVWGPPCSLWIFLSIAVSKRTKSKPYGDLTNINVQIANLICENTTLSFAQRIFTQQIGQSNHFTKLVWYLAVCGIIL